jgi:hypothetical protein
VNCLIVSKLNTTKQTTKPAKDKPAIKKLASTNKDTKSKYVKRNDKIKDINFIMINLISYKLFISFDRAKVKTLIDIKKLLLIFF